ncbi:hypothetical protein BH23GEM2_BH23GEM2_09500 [soil metagenome]
MTGNHWLALPCIHPADGSLHAVGVVNRAARAAVEFAGSADFLDGGGTALVRPVLTVGGERRELAAGGIAWERALGWLPTFRTGGDDVSLRGTIFAPYGRDADVAGAVYALSVENRSTERVDVDLALEGTLGHRQQRIRSPRAFDDAHRAVEVASQVIVLDGAALPAYAALAIGADGDASLTITPGATPGWSVGCSMSLDPGERRELAFYLGAGPERDGAEATVGVMRRRGWRELLRATRAALQSFEQTTGNDALDRVLNRNLLFTYFYSVARALDDAHFYVVRTRSPWNSHGVTISEWEALWWIIAAVELADPELARELLLRMCELHGYAPGSGIRYLDGTLFQAGFAIEAAAAYPIAFERYMSRTGDDAVLEEPSVAETLYAVWEDIESRRDGHRPLYSTEVTLSGEPAPLPFTAHANAVVAHALEILKRTLDEKSAERVEDAEAVRASLRSDFATSAGADAVLHTAIDLSGVGAREDDPVSSLLWLPFHGAISRDDAVYRRTVGSLDVDGASHLATQCARLLGSHSRDLLEWVRRAPLDNGLAAEIVDEQGRAVENGGDAALAGLLAYTVWHAVHTIGVQT